MPPNPYGLGRVPSRPDPRDADYPVRTLIERTYGAVPTGAAYRYWWENGAWYDQGATGTCVGHGWAHEIEDAPVTHPDDLVDPFAIYDLATTLDPWDDNDGDRQAGTSVRAGAAASGRLGYIGSFWWATQVDDVADIDAVADAVLYVGPCVIGVGWTDPMFDPPFVGRHSILGLPEVSAPVVGGHCLVVNGVNRTSQTFRLKNSWGRGWADDGHCRITFEALAYLLDRDGEACVPSDIPAGG
jgi:hypothetical protein